ncbi:MAG: FliI/YscN family ATPase [Planctomycetales bacterium]|nr:FliI/YscN family ATPase [Planctomycetales bacterium]
MLTATAQLDEITTTDLVGSVARTIGMTAAAEGMPAPVGALVEIERASGGPLQAEVIGFNGHLTLLYPFGDLSGVRRGNRVRLCRTKPWLRVGEQLLGRVIDAQGRCIDGRPEPVRSDRVAIDNIAPTPTSRPRIDTPLSTGIRAIDGLLTCGRGQRMGIFSGSGVGKSTSLGMMARYTDADVTVVGLVGERGREVNEFLEKDLGPEGRARSVVVVSTSDAPAVLRIRAALTATSIAEYFRDQGKNVLLLMDSLTRCAQAQREIGLAAGEPPTTRGYPPSVFSLLPRIVERAGRTTAGSITAFYTVLVEADDPNEPIGDAVRGLLDGHTWLSRSLASQGHYPAIDVLESLSRLMSDITPEEQQDAATVLRMLLSAYRDHEDLISIGAYRRGSNPTVDLAVDVREEIHQYLRQRVNERSTIESARNDLLELIRTCQGRRQGAANQQRTDTAGGSPIASNMR